jgi:hypothetical protein
LGSSSCSLFIECDDGIKRSIVAGDLLQMRIQHFGGGHLPLTDIPGQLLGGHEHKIIIHDVCSLVSHQSITGLTDGTDPRRVTVNRAVGSSPG